MLISAFERFTCELLGCREYGCNICGEGGEFESLTLDCPLFKHGRIVVDQWSKQSESAGHFASVGTLCPVRFHVESKAAHVASPEVHGDSMHAMHATEGTATPPGPHAGRADQHQQQQLWQDAHVTEVPQDYQPAVAEAAPQLVYPDSYSPAAKAHVRVSSVGLHVTCAPQLSQAAAADTNSCACALHHAIVSIAAGRRPSCAV